jgi:hypothetical protein
LPIHAPEKTRIKLRASLVPEIKISVNILFIHNIYKKRKIFKEAGSPHF